MGFQAGGTGSSVGIAPGASVDVNGLPFGIVDLFSRLRISQPETIFDSKQIFSKQEQFWDESTSGTASVTYDQNGARTILSVDKGSPSSALRQTFRRFNYEPGKSQLILLTGTPKANGVDTGATKELGLFDDANGTFFRWNGNLGTASVVIRSSVTGIALENEISQSFWDDPMDGSGPSGITLDFDNIQIFFIAFEWLGAGSVQYGIFYNGKPYLVHQVNHANEIPTVYMSTPNLPIRYSVSSDGTGAGTAELDQVCCTVISEGSQDKLGVTTYVSTEDNDIQCNSGGTEYAILGIRLKSNAFGASVFVENIGGFAETNDAGEWFLILNPTITGDPIVWSDQPNRSIQYAIADTSNPNTNEITAGEKIDGGYIDGSVELNIKPDTAFFLGSSISGTPDELWLGWRPFTNGSDFYGSITVKELL